MVSLRSRRSAGVTASSRTASSATSMDSLNVLIDRLAGLPTSEQVIAVALQALVRDFPMGYSSCWWADDEAGTLTMRADAGDPGGQMAAASAGLQIGKGVGPLGQAWSQGTVAVSDQMRTLTHSKRAMCAVARDLEVAVAFPLMCEGRVVGVLDGLATLADAPTQEHLVTLLVFGKLVSQALERVLQVERRLETDRDMSVMARVVAQVADVNSENEAVEVVLATLRSGYGWEHATLWVPGDGGGWCDSARPEERVMAGLPVQAGTSGQLVFHEDLRASGEDAHRLSGMVSAVAVPVLIKRRVAAVIEVASRSAIDLTPDRRNAMTNTAVLLASAMVNAQAAARVQQAGSELLSSIGEVERNVTQAGVVAGRAQEIARSAGQMVAHLSSSSREIGNVVKVITSIAEQTNLLALNATIEAARAGQAGKGFAVVAGEVKELARETAKATEEVSAKVTAIQDDSHNVVEALEQVAQSVAEINVSQEAITDVLAHQHSTTRGVLQQ